MANGRALCGCMNKNRFSQDGMHGTPALLISMAVVHSKALDMWTPRRKQTITEVHIIL